MLKKFLILTCVGTITIGGFLFKIYEPSKTVKQSKTPYVEENAIDTIETNDQKEISSNQENLNNKEEKVSVTEPEKSNDNVKANDSNQISSPKKSNDSPKVEQQTATISTPKVTVPTIYYDRTTSIYENDNKTLIRVEYYANNKLVYYSSVEQFDVATNSYIEKIYKYDYENNIQILVRTDVYSNGNLIKSY